MSKKTNMGASVRQRLLNIAREQGEDFQQILVRYALERLLYRLAQSSHSERFVLKGARCSVCGLIWISARHAMRIFWGSAVPSRHNALRYFVTL
jgi:hypothetical protein